MKKIDRINALQIASKYDIKVVRSWWSPFQNVAWEVLNSHKELTMDQYRYLSNNHFLDVKEIVKENETNILTISELGKQRLQSLL